MSLNQQHGTLYACLEGNSCAVTFPYDTKLLLPHRSWHHTEFTAKSRTANVRNDGSSLKLRNNSFTAIPEVKQLVL